MRILFIIFLTFIIAAAAKGEQPSDWLAGDALAADTTKSAKEDATPPLILLPDPDPYNMYTYRDSRHEYVQTGIFFGGYGLGFETMYRPEMSNIYAGLLTVSGSNTTISANKARMSMFTGATAGYHYTLGSKASSHRFPGERESFHFYMRTGPGIGITSVRRLNDNFRTTSERELGMFLSGHSGMVVPLSERSLFYVEAGWRGFWFPGTDDLSFFGGPSLTFGFTYSFGGGFDQYRF